MDTWFDDGPEITEELVQQSECIPLGSQQEVDLQAQQWKAEWAVGSAPPVLPWPAEVCNSHLPEVTVQIVRRAAYTFPVGTGLGWDKLHPRAVARCSDEALAALVRIFILAELLGRWPELVGIVLICLLPKPDGGRRPIPTAVSRLAYHQRC